ncbi:TetR/AcrR family transcriptional regulator [Streptomyces sp. NPDC050355]|uniref:TetR/AcrR family transcriptional regulator n=1 Tax=Streptomyces sirii TaxID=3127701 RepID=A0ABZ2QL76_9ACTN
MSLPPGPRCGAVRGTAPGGAPNSRRSATRRRLFDAAVTLIAEQGFSATTVDEIADRAGVAKGTVYYNFASKNVLYEELLRDGLDQLADSLQHAADTTAGRGGTRIDALDAMIRAGLDFIARSPALTQLYVAELWRTNRSWRATVASVRGRALTVVESVLRDAVRTGELSDELDIPLTASALLGMVLVAALDWLSFQPDRSVEEVHASLARLVQGRVGARPPQEGRCGAPGATA